jgi:hypothetical protein
MNRVLSCSFRAAAILLAAQLLGRVALVSATEPTPPLPAGSLLFLENCSSVVERTTQGQIGHVALVFFEGSTPWVYEATPAKVRRITLEAYDIELARLNRGRDADEAVRTHVLRPKQPYRSEEVAAMRSYLDRQLGRRYSVKNYVRGKPYDGIHCAELASSTLNESKRYVFKECHKITPQALYSAIEASYVPANHESLAAELPKESWCTRAKRRTSGWFTWCGWSCREAWLFFW